MEASHTGIGVKFGGGAEGVEMALYCGYMIMQVFWYTVIQDYQDERLWRLWIMGNFYLL